jgi:Pumilio-family RNA binding repeat
MGNGSGSMHSVRELILSGGNSHGGGTKEVLTAKDLIGRAEELARDQQGCRASQRAIEEGDPECINIIFNECFGRFVELTTHAFANYLTQKIFQYCSDDQRLALVRQCAPAMATISTNMHGTRAVQRMVECLSTPEQVRAVCEALAPAAVPLMCDINGNHVIQKVLHRMEPADNQFVYDAVANNCYELATQRHACCVMQRCMDFATPQQRDQLAVQIIANALPLVSNCYSNYVVQYLLDLNIPAYTEAIVSRLRGNVASLSMQKFASNVIEKSLQNSSQQCRQHLIAELIDPNVMSRLLLDSYANYVIQRALMVAEGEQLEQLCEVIRPHLGALKSSAYGKRIQAKLLKRMPKVCLPLPAVSTSPSLVSLGSVGGSSASSSQLRLPHNETSL